MDLDDIQRLAQEQFAKQSHRYGQGHILENVEDVRAAAAVGSRGVDVVRNRRVCAEYFRRRVARRLRRMEDADRRDRGRNLLSVQRSGVAGRYPLASRVDLDPAPLERLVRARGLSRLCLGFSPGRAAAGRADLRSNRPGTFREHRGGRRPPAAVVCGRQQG